MADQPPPEQPDPNFSIEDPEQADAFFVQLKEFLEKNDMDVILKLRKKKGRGDKSEATGVGLEGGECNIPSKAKLKAKDYFGNPCDHGGDPVDVVVTAPDGSQVPVTVTDNGDGTYDIDFTPVSPGPHVVDIKICGEQVADTPKTVPIDPPTPDPQYCYAEGPGLEKAETAHDAPFVIYAKNKIDEPITIGGHPFQVAVTGPSGPCDATVEDNGDGTYNASYKPKEAGKHKIDVTIFDQPIKDSPFEVEVALDPLGPDPSKTYATGKGVEGGCTTADDAEFVIHAVTPLGEEMKTGGYPFEATVKDPDGKTLPCPIKDNEDGTYTGVYEPTKPGVYEVDIVLKNKYIPDNEDRIKDSPFSPEIAPGIEPSQCKAYGPGLEDEVDDVNQTEFTIEARDYNGDPLHEGGHPFKVEVIGPNGEDVPCEIKDNGDGTYKVEYSPENPGIHKIRCTLDGEDINGSPVEVDVLEGIDPQCSGVDSFSFVIQARSKKGEAKTKGGGKFTVEIDGKTESGEKIEIPEEHINLRDAGDGKYHVTYKISESGKYNINCLVKGRHIKSSPFKQEI